MAPGCTSSEPTNGSRYGNRPGRDLSSGRVVIAEATLHFCCRREHPGIAFGPMASGLRLVPRRYSDDHHPMNCHNRHACNCCSCRPALKCLHGRRSRFSRTIVAAALVGVAGKNRRHNSVVGQRTSPLGNPGMGVRHAECRWREGVHRWPDNPNVDTGHCWFDPCRRRCATTDGHWSAASLRETTEPNEGELAQQEAGRTRSSCIQQAQTTR